MKNRSESFLERTQRSRLKAIQFTGQRKAFCKKRIPRSSFARKKTLDRDIFETSRNYGRKTMLPIRITSNPVM